MKASRHVAATLLISSVVYYWFYSVHAFLGSLIGGILIDIDHLLDYYLHKGINLKLNCFFDWCYNNRWTRLVLFFHSIELMFLLWFVITYFHPGIFWLGLAIGMTQHLLSDIIFNKDINPLSYFFVLRFLHGFKKEYILRGGHE